jgi:hypothetical protein
MGFSSSSPANILRGVEGAGGNQYADHFGLRCPGEVILLVESIVGSCIRPTQRNCPASLHHKEEQRARPERY